MIQIIPETGPPLSPYLYMQFAEPLGNADASIDAAWNSLEENWQEPAIEIIRKLAPPMIRWGGCFSSYYHWQEAVGPREKRLPILNLTWEGVFSNQVGTAEIVQLCRRVGAEPLFCVNFESDGRKNWAFPRPDLNRLGTAGEAAEWVAYCNDPDHPLRRAHGDPAPYHIRYWQLGNETSYGYPEATGSHRRVRDGFSCRENIAALKRFSDAMRATDSSLKLIAWGDDDWAPQVCEEAGDRFDLIAFHCHYNYPADGSRGAIGGNGYRRDPDATWACLMATRDEVDRKIAHLAEQVRPCGKRLAMTEGHYIVPGRNRGDVLSTWAAGVAYARILNVFERHCDILEIATCADFFGNRWQVNAVMLPTPVWSGRPFLMPVGQVMALYRNHTGKHAVPASCSDPDVDLTASIDGDRIFLHLVNTAPGRAVRLPIAVVNRTIRKATAWEISADPMLEVIEPTAARIEPVARRIENGVYTLPAAGVAAIELDLEERQNLDSPGI